MPHPLRTLAKRGIHLSLKIGLDNAPPELCILALKIIAQWSVAERDLATFIISLVPGKAAPIAEMLNSSRADSPKKAIRNALVMSHLSDDEATLFEAMQSKYESCYKLRNPLAHWTLGTCKQVPTVITATNPENYIKISAMGESEIDMLIRDMASSHNPSKMGSARISDKTASAMMPTYEKQVDAAVAYTDKCLTGMLSEITNLVTAIRHFRMVVRFRCLNVATEKRAELLSQLSEQLGLSQPTAK